MRAIAALLLSILLLHADEIDELLRHYRIDTDLSRQTIDESQGYLTLYTRDDLERMQAYSLKDLLRSVRYFRYGENLFGQPDLLHLDPVAYMSDPIRVYVNNHEVYSGYIGSGFFIYGDMDLAFVDHVEIYAGASSLEINTEPAVMIIKLFSRDPERENGHRVQAYVAHTGSNHQNFTISHLFEDYSLLTYVARNELFRTVHSHANHELNRDYTRTHLFTSLSSTQHRVDLELIRKRAEPFLSASMYVTPRPGELAQDIGRVALSSKFLDDTLQLQLSYQHGEFHSDLKSTGTLWSLKASDWFLPDDHLTTYNTDDAVTAQLSKELKLDKHHLRAGIAWRHKVIHTKRFERNGVNALPAKRRSEADIYSPYLQNRYWLSDHQMLMAAAKVNFYDNRLAPQSIARITFQGRLGFIYTGERFRFKTFAEHNDFVSEQYLLSTTISDEESMIQNDSFSFETAYHTKTLDLSLQTGHHQIYSKKINEAMGSYRQNVTSGNLEAHYRFDAFNSIKLQYGATWFNNPDDTKQLGQYILARTLNTWGRWDLFNELMYRGVERSLSFGNDVSTGIRFRVTPDVIASFKGSNVFNSAPKGHYVFVDRHQQFSLQKLEISPVDREYLFALEWTF